MEFSLKDEAFRGYLYRIATIAFVVLIGKGVVTREDADLMLPLVAALLSVGLAAGNTSIKPDDNG